MARCEINFVLLIGRGKKLNRPCDETNAPDFRSRKLETFANTGVSAASRPAEIGTTVLKRTRVWTRASPRVHLISLLLSALSETRFRGRDYFRRPSRGTKGMASAAGYLDRARARARAGRRTTNLQHRRTACVFDAGQI
jgi:hypothetical protein